MRAPRACCSRSSRRHFHQQSLVFWFAEHFLFLSYSKLKCRIVNCWFAVSMLCNGKVNYCRQEKVKKLRFIESKHCLFNISVCVYGCARRLYMMYDSLFPFDWKYSDRGRAIQKRRQERKKKFWWLAFWSGSTSLHSIPRSHFPIAEHSKTK